MLNHQECQQKAAKGGPPLSSGAEPRPRAIKRWPIDSVRSPAADGHRSTLGGPEIWFRNGLRHGRESESSRLRSDWMVFSPFYLFDVFGRDNGHKREILAGPESRFGHGCNLSINGEKRE